MITVGFVLVALGAFALGWATAFAVYAGRARQAELDRRATEDKIIDTMLKPRPTIEPPSNYFGKGGRA